MKKCTGECGLEKDEEEFPCRDKVKKIFRNECKVCRSKYDKQQYNKNKDKILKNKKQYHDEHKKEVKENNKLWYLKNKKEKKKHSKRYKLKNKNRVKEARRKYEKNKKNNDPTFKLRKNVSRLVHFGLKVRGTSKRGNSFFKSINYTPQQLMDHLMSHPEKEEWMNENNQGIYDPKTWDDDNPLTWTWQLDHIVPHSTFNYISMEDEEFKKCWSLENLRPLSAKQNQLDGTTRTRHKKIC